MPQPIGRQAAAPSAGVVIEDPKPKKQTLFGTKMDALFFQKQSLEKFSSKLSAKKKKKQNKTKTTSTRKPKFVKQTSLVENLLVLCIHELNE